MPGNHARQSSRLAQQVSKQDLQEKRGMTAAAPNSSVDAAVVDVDAPAAANLCTVGPTPDVFNFTVTEITNFHRAEPVAGPMNDALLHEQRCKKHMYRFMSLLVPRASARGTKHLISRCGQI